jgi:hypothetical protein
MNSSLQSYSLVEIEKRGARVKPLLMLVACVSEIRSLERGFSLRLGLCSVYLVLLLCWRLLDWWRTTLCSRFESYGAARIEKELIASMMARLHRRFNETFGRELTPTTCDGRLPNSVVKVSYTSIRVDPRKQN